MRGLRPFLRICALKTKVKRGSKTKDMSPETLRGLRGLLSSVLKEAVVAEPPLRDRNPCDLTRLPSNDDWGIGDDESSDDMEFMTPEEIAGLVECFPRPSVRMLVRTAHGSGLRWGEISALVARHARNPRPDEYELRVTLAWKRVPGEEWYLGPPKSKAGRRTIEITAGLWQELLDHGLAGLGKDELIFHDGSGGLLPYSTFYDGWMAGSLRPRSGGCCGSGSSPACRVSWMRRLYSSVSSRRSRSTIKRFPCSALRSSRVWHRRSRMPSMRCWLTAVWRSTRYAVCSSARRSVARRSRSFRIMALCRANE